MWVGGLEAGANGLTALPDAAEFLVALLLLRRSTFLLPELDSILAV